jgi:membrane associated rhomboid family serine protease
MLERAATVTAVETGIQTCHWHPDQRAGVICQRCDRPICPRCMHQASVGFHCPDCTKQGAQKVIRGPAAVGGSVPVLTRILIAINVAVFLAEAVVTKGRSLSGEIDSFSVQGGLLAKGFYHGGFIGVAHGQVWRLVTSGFLHYGIIHILFNMYALYILGSWLERSAGRGRLAAVYSVSLLAGAFGALILSPNSLTAGASGAIYGLMGAFFAAGRTQGISVRQSPLFGILLLNLLLTFGLGGLSIGGHLGGLAGGVLAGWVLFDWAPKQHIAPAMSYAICGLIGAACVVGSLLVASSHGQLVLIRLSRPAASVPGGCASIRTGGPVHRPRRRSALPSTTGRRDALPTRSGSGRPAGR